MTPRTIIPAVPIRGQTKLATVPMAGQADVLAPGIRRLLAPNPGLMTGPGTNTYLLGETTVAVLDPGPAMPEHIDAIQALAPGPIRWILATHTHPDHSPAARPLADATGARLLGRRPPPGPNQDQTFEPDQVLGDGDRLEAKEFVVRAIHTPGHASNHLCYLHEGLHWVFTGDHVMNGSTVVINPPDGHMRDYLDSIERLKMLDPAKLAPGHGEVLDDPTTALDWIVAHRLEREEKVVAALASAGGGTLGDLVSKAYDDVPTRLHRLAERSLLAHLIKLREDNRAREENHRWYPATDQE